MGDTTTIWLLGLWELYRGTSDAGLLRDLYPYVPRAVAWQASVSAAYGLPAHLTCTYDILELEKVRVAISGRFAIRLCTV